MLRKKFALLDEIHSNGDCIHLMIPVIFLRTKENAHSRKPADHSENRLETLWSALYKNGIDREFLFSRSLLSPATCCLVNPDGERTVEAAFKTIINLSARLREKYGLAGN